MKCKWTNGHHEVLDTIKAVVAQEKMLCYPNHTFPFIAYVDATDKQPGARMSQLGANNKSDICDEEEVLKHDHT